jgi:hypothetical protein
VAGSGSGRAQTGRAYATTEPPGDPHEWTVYREGEFVVQVDDAIVAPQRWVVALAKKEGRHLDARWNGNDPAGAFGRLPLVDSTPEEPTATRRWSDLVLGGFALLGSVVWVLGIAGVHRWWFDDVRFVWLGASLLLALFAVALSRLWRRVHPV